MKTIGTIIVTALFVGLLTWFITYTILKNRWHSLENQLHHQVSELEEKVKKSQNQLAPIPSTVTEIANPTSSSDQLYTGEDASFSLSYPHDWTINPTPKEGEAELLNPGRSNKIIISTVANPNNLNGETLYQAIRPGNEHLVQSEKPAINTALAAKLKIQGIRTTFYRVFIPHGNRMIVLTSLGDHDHLDEITRTVRTLK